MSSVDKHFETIDKLVFFVCFAVVGEKILCLFILGLTLDSLDWGPVEKANL